MNYFLIAYTVMLLNGVSAHGQSVEHLLTPAIAALAQATGTEAQQHTANEFERIALAHPKSWHANYYTAYSYVLLAFSSRKGDADALCDRAQEYLDRAFTLQPKNAENHVLAAYLLSARINVNPMFRGAGMGGESKTHLTKALELDPANPRALYVRGMGIYRTPSAFGGGKKKAKLYLDRARQNFNTAKAASAIEPQWGKKETEQLLATYSGGED